MISFYSDMQKDAMQYRQQYIAAATSRQVANRKYVKAVMAMDKGKKTLYPDANFTMRLTYGTVKHYDPRDAVKFDWETTDKGIIEKYVPGDQEFDVPQELRTAIAKKDYGRYATDGTMPVCFLTNNDITGGNSGSPVLNANGDLIGLAFDGNYEGTGEQYIFEEPLNRTICVSANYVLFVIDKVYGNTNLIKELSVIDTDARSMK